MFRRFLRPTDALVMHGPADQANTELMVPPRPAGSAPRVQGEITLRNWAIVVLFAVGGGSFLVGALVAVAQSSLWYVPVVVVYLLLAARVARGFLRETASSHFPAFRLSRSGISEALTIAWMAACSLAFGVLLIARAKPAIAAIPLVVIAFFHFVIVALGAGVTNDLDRTPPRWGILTSVFKTWGSGSPKLRDAGEPIGCAIQIALGLVCLGFWAAAWVVVEVAATGLLRTAAVVFWPYTRLMGTQRRASERARLRLLVLGLPLAVVPAALVGLLLSRIWVWCGLVDH